MFIKRLLYSHDQKNIEKVNFQKKNEFEKLEQNKVNLQLHYHWQELNIYYIMNKCTRERKENKTDTLKKSINRIINKKSLET